MKNFEKIFVIGFPESKRIKNFYKIFEGFNVELVEAVNGEDIIGASAIQNRRSPECRPETTEFYNKFKTKNDLEFCSAHNMTTREVACCLSHLKAHRRVIAGNYKNVLILEDDVCPTAGIDLLNDLTLDGFDWDIIMLNRKFNAPYNFVKTKADTICSYLVRNAESSSKYIKCFKNGLFVADHPMSSYDLDLDVYCTTKAYFYHDNRTSVIDSRF